jgi:hypothetical protein
VWPGEKTTAGFDVTGLDVLENDVVIVPKLFRRLVDYLNLGDDSMAGFPAFLDQAADKFFILSTDLPDRGPRLRREAGIRDAHGSTTARTASCSPTPTPHREVNTFCWPRTRRSVSRPDCELRRSCSPSATSVIRVATSPR